MLETVGASNPLLENKDAHQRPSCCFPDLFIFVSAACFRAVRLPACLLYQFPVLITFGGKSIVLRHYLFTKEY